MAKGNNQSGNREKKKPKADKKVATGTAPSPFIVTPGKSTPAQKPAGKK